MPVLVCYVQLLAALNHFKGEVGFARTMTTVICKYPTQYLLFGCNLKSMLSTGAFQFHSVNDLHLQAWFFSLGDLLRDSLFLELTVRNFFLPNCYILELEIRLKAKRVNGFFD